MSGAGIKTTPRASIAADGPLVSLDVTDERGRRARIWVTPFRALQLVEDASRAAREAAEVERGEGLS